MLADDDFYVGAVNRRGQPNGQGVVFNLNGTVKIVLAVDPVDASNSGRWIAGKLNGRATALWTNDRYYDGSHKNGLCDGLGVCWDKDDGHYEGEFSRGHQSGLGAKWDRYGKLAQCGRWAMNELERACAVPLRFLPQGKYLRGAGQPHAAR